MRLIKFLFSIWALSASIFSLLFVFPLYILLLKFSPNGFISAHHLSRIWAKYLMTIWLSPVKVKGEGKIDLNQTYILVSNHQSQIDIPVAALATKVPFKFLAKNELTKIPLLGFIIKSMYITVERGSTTQRFKSYLKMKDCLLEGISVWLFPEGTRNKTEEKLGQLNDGAFKLSVEMGIPMMVCNIKGTKKVLPAGKMFEFFPNRVELEWFGPFLSEDYQELKSKFIDCF